MKIKLEKVFLIFILISAFIPCPADARNFDPNYLISDRDLVESRMSLEQIQNFLEENKSSLATYLTNDKDGRLKTAAEIIYQASQTHQINPQVILTLIQKEQTLITQSPQKISQYDWATGFAAYDGQKPVQKFKGFAIQVDQAAWRLRYFLEHPWEFRFRPNLNYRIDRYLVTPENLATAGLYNYTPHIYGNRLFWQIWQSWFQKQADQLERSLVRVKNEIGVWLIQNGQRRPFYSRQVFLAKYSFDQVKTISRQDLEKYEIGEPMDFPQYSLLESPDQQIFLLADGQKRPISRTIFKEIGFHPDEVVKASWSDLEKYSEGKPIVSPYPNGALLQDKTTGAIYYVRDEFKYPLWSKDILLNNFPYQKIISADPAKLNRFISVEPVKFNDGTLIKTSGSPAVFVVVQGKRRPIYSEETFEALGYQWENIITVSEKVLNIHPLGETLDINKLP